jgi:hypothetical protein
VRLKGYRCPGKDSNQEYSSAIEHFLFVRVFSDVISFQSCTSKVVIVIVVVV